MNHLFVAYKPSWISSSQFLSKLKRKYGIKKAGFSGTLDPFAKGVLLIGFGSHTRLFRFLDKTPKRYRATLWLGAKSDTLDTEMFEYAEIIKELKFENVKNKILELQGNLRYEPPIFSAKHINGKRAYDLARAGIDFELEKIDSYIYESELINYSHPFISFEVSVSEGTYIRSLGKIIANNLGVKNGILSSLERLSEGKFIFDNEKKLDIKKSLKIEKNEYLANKENIRFGRVLDIKDIKNKNNGEYWLDNKDNITIISIKENVVKYELGKIYVN